MSRCTVAMAAKASSTATCRAAAGWPVTVISTKVPSSGRARRTLAQAGGIDRQDALDALGHVMGGQRGARNVTDVAVHFERIVQGLADELGEPGMVGDLATVGLAVLENLHP